MNLKILITLFTLFFSSLYAAGSSSSSSSSSNESAPSTNESASKPDHFKEYKMAIKLIRKKEYKSAIRNLKMLVPVVSNDFSRADVFNEIGFAYRKSEDFDNAAKYYKKALDLDPEHLGAIEYQGEMYVDLGQKENALNNLALLEKLVGENNSYYKELSNYISNN